MRCARDDVRRSGSRWPTKADLLVPVSAATYKPPSIQERILQIQDILAQDVDTLDATTRENTVTES